VAQGKKESLTQYLTDVFENRFGRPVEVRVVYEKAKDSSLKYNEVKLQQEVDAIMDHADAVKAEKALEKEAKEAKEAKRREDAEIDRVIREILRIPADDPSSNEPTPAA
jgi:uncharacterized protein (DUF1697 family)